LAPFNPQAMTIQSKKPILIWLFSGCFLIYAMVVLGGITRLTHSGLSMVEWNMIVGSMPPMSDADWQVPFEKYKLTPEFQKLNYQFSLDEFKSIYWWEYSHRLLGRTIGLVFLIPFLYFWIRKKIDKALFNRLVVVLILGGFQGVLGWYMVKSGLIKDPHVSHYRLAAHLISAFLVFGFTFWIALDILFPIPKNKQQVDPLSGIRKAAYVLFAFVVVQIIYGAFVAGLKAGYYYPTFPKMGDEWMPDGVTFLQPLWKNFMEGIPGVQFVHRYIAYVVLFLISFIWYRSRKLNLLPTQKMAANILFTVVWFQFTLGVLTLLYSVPVCLGVLHQTGAFFLFASTLFFIHQFKMGTVE